MARCSSVSMPSARTTAPVRSAWALTAFMISAIAGPGRSCTRRRSSLTTSGREQRQEGQRHRVGADVVDRDAPAEGADALDGAQQLGGPGGQGPLGDLEDDAQLAGGALGDGEQVVERGAVEHLGLDVDEHRQRGQQTLLDRAAEGGGAADLVQLGQPAGGAGGGEQQVGALAAAPRGRGPAPRRRPPGRCRARRSAGTRCAPRRVPEPPRARSPVGGIVHVLPSAVTRRPGEPEQRPRPLRKGETVSRAA